MKVIATRAGYFAHRYRPEGSVFIIPDKPVRKSDGKPQAFGTWMDEVKDPSVPVKDARIGDADVARQVKAESDRQSEEPGAQDQEVI